MTHLSILPRPWSLPPRGSAPPIVDRKPVVLVLDGAACLSRQLASTLGQCGYEIVVRATPDRANELLREVSPDLLLIDMSLKSPSGFELCSELRATEIGRAIPIILMSSDTTDDQEVSRGLMCGADDFLNVRDRPGEFQARVRVQLRNKRERDRSSRLAKERDAYRHEAIEDGLTGIPNRRSVDKTLATVFAERRPFAAFFVDVDHFKRVNDTFGHETGDEVLKAIGGRLRRFVQTGNHCGRYGGEEFIVFLLDANVEVAMTTAEELRREIQELTLPVVGSVTVSIGVAVFDPARPDANAPALLGRADAALYEAKRTGRNRVVAAQAHGAKKTAPTVAAAAVTSSASSLEGVESTLLRQLATGRAGLPLLPEAAAKALRLAEDPHTNMSEIAQLVERDPPLAARFTAIAGSAVYSRGARVTTMHTALVRIGLASARDLLLQVVYERTNAEMSRYQGDVARSFDHSVRTAVAAQCIAKNTSVTYARAYLCGLLHDIGEARIYRILDGIPNIEVAPEIVSTLVARHHMRAGADVARAWNLPEDIVDACMHHHEDIEAAPPQVRLVVAAEKLAETLGTQPRTESGEPAPLPALELRMLELVGVPANRVDAVVRELARQLARSDDDSTPRWSPS